jgi:hypothetical protein
MQLQTFFGVHVIILTFVNILNEKNNWKKNVDLQIV